MKLLNRLRELRDELSCQQQIDSEYAFEFEPDEHSQQDYYNAGDINHYHLDTIGVGTTTIDDIIRLNLEQLNLQTSNSQSSSSQTNAY